MMLTRFLHLQIYNEAGTSVEYDNKVDTTWGIDTGSMSLDKILMDSELRFGECNSAKLEVKIFGLDVDLSNRKIRLEADETLETLDTWVDNGYNTIIADTGDMFVFRTGTTERTKVLFSGYIDSCTKDYYSTDRVIVAYDWMYSHREYNIADIWNTFWASRETSDIETLKAYVLQQLGLTDVTEYIFSTFLITNPFTQPLTSFKLETFLQSICIIQCCTPVMTDFDDIEFMRLKDIPSLYSVTDNTEGANSTWEDYTTAPITGVGIYDSSDSLAQLVGTADNVYKISGNIFLLNMDATTLALTANDILTRLSYIQSYTPTDLKCIVSNLDYELGDYIETEKGNTYIMSMSLSGSLLVEQELKGVSQAETLSDTVDSFNDEIINNYKLAKITKNIDEFAVEFADFQEETSTKFEQTSKEIRTEVNGVLVGSIADEAWVTSNTLSTISDFWSDATPSTPISHYNEIVCTEYVPTDLNLYASAEDNEGMYFLVHTGGTSATLYQSVYNEATDNYDWVSQSRFISINSYDRNVLTVDLSNDASYADFVLEDKIGLCVDLTLGTDLTNTTREVWLKLILPPKSGVIKRTCYRPIYINGEKMTDEYTKSGDTITLIYTDYESITTDLVQPEGFKGVWAVTVDTRVQSSIDQLANQIVLKVETATGKIVQVELGADANTGTEFKVSADNISFIANKKIELTSNQLEINSTYFKVSSAGAITCTSGDIGGWSIDSNRLYKTITSGSVSKTTYLKPGELKFYGTDIVDKPNSILSNSGLRLYNDSTLTLSLDGSARDNIVLLTTNDLLAGDYKRQSNWSGTNTNDLNTAIGYLTAYTIGKGAQHISPAYCYGYITNGASELRLCITMDLKSDVTACVVTACKLYLRQSSGGYVISNGYQLGSQELSGASITIKRYQRLLVVVFPGSSWGTNNSVVSGYVDISFTLS